MKPNPSSKALPLILCLLCACPREHPAASVEVRQGDCVTCHLADYQSASPPHPGSFPTTCRDCHSTAGWIPALQGAHPEARFPIAGGAHQGIACGDCHDAARGSSVAGANTSCIGCHGGDHTQARMDPEHQGVSGYVFDANTPNFCLSCHPDGKGGRHPEDRFPIAGGAHSGMACNDCHVPSAGSYVGGANTSCIGCHTGEHNQTRVDAQHREEADYQWQGTMPHFCLTCHPRGRN